MKKMLPWIITILLAITLIAVVAVFLFNQLFNGSSGNDALDAKQSVNGVHAEKLSANKRVELTSVMSDIKTNLADPSYIAVMGLAFQLDKKSTKEDFDKIKDIQIKPIILRVLSDLKPEELNGSKGKDAMSAKLINLINPVLPTGKLVNIEVIEFMIQPLY
ncbi:flagellar basal body-associated FliL family protein [Paenibacillus sp. GCM10012307]|uniref:Flagellar protein FliL n=1 Tax=Paenibacillus roseus TaxID=2798579 RepID=A0A934MMI9_9BACL|nr:flagellar basal body-associated FliL family protein [Paenibacillus roseus]MBJ6363385.1 flagellar basal body-associated FliL family protein [Paenibacillus roseus]